MRFERGRDTRQNVARVSGKAEDPAAPGAVGSDIGELTVFEVRSGHGDVVEVPSIERGQESLGLVDGHHTAARADEAGEVDGGVSGAAADIQHYLARAKSRGPPGGQRVGAPSRVLEAEALDFLVVGAEHVVRRRSHRARVSRRGSGFYPFVAPESQEWSSGRRGRGLLSHS